MIFYDLGFLQNGINDGKICSEIKGLSETAAAQFPASDRGGNMIGQRECRERGRVRESIFARRPLFPLKVLRSPLCGVVAASLHDPSHRASHPASTMGKRKEREKGREVLHPADEGDRGGRVERVAHGRHRSARPLRCCRISKAPCNTYISGSREESIDGGRHPSARRLRRCRILEPPRSRYASGLRRQGCVSLSQFEEERYRCWNENVGVDTVGATQAFDEMTNRSTIGKPV
ncbi:hypothetical protein ACLOJK_006503 [Asimina triloba]